MIPGKACARSRERGAGAGLGGELVGFSKFACLPGLKGNQADDRVYGTGGSLNG